MDFALTSEQEAMRRLARDFAQRRVAPGVSERDRTKTFPHELIKEMADLGFLGLPFPETYGGAGCDTVTVALVIEELAKVDASLAITLAAHLSLAASPIYQFGSEEQKRRWLTPLAKGDMLGSFGLTEPEAGSDAGGTRTRAVRDGDRWTLNGEKIFITNATVSGLAVVTAVTEPGRGTAGISSFIVPKGTPGFAVGQPYDKLGFRSSDTAPLYFADCEVPAENLLGQEGHGFKQFLATLDGGRIGIGALSVGIAQGAFELACSYAQQRAQFGRQLAQFQAIAFKLADMHTQIEIARLGVLKAAWLKDQGQPYGKAAAMAKLFASETAVDVTREALQIYGGHGYVTEYPIERYYRDAKLMEIGEGTSEVQRLVIARELGCTV